MSEAPDFINPPRLVDMTPQEATDFLEGIRMRRLVAVHYYQEVQAERARTKELSWTVSSVSWRLGCKAASTR
jgi:hypothetical protein